MVANRVQKTQRHVEGLMRKFCSDVEGVGSDAPRVMEEEGGEDEPRERVVFVQNTPTSYDRLIELNKQRVQSDFLYNIFFNPVDAKSRYAELDFVLRSTFAEIMQVCGQTEIWECVPLTVAVEFERIMRPQNWCDAEYTSWDEYTRDSGERWVPRMPSPAKTEEENIALLYVLTHFRWAYRWLHSEDGGPRLVNRPATIYMLFRDRQGHVSVKTQLDEVIRGTSTRTFAEILVSTWIHQNELVSVYIDINSEAAASYQAMVPAEPKTRPAIPRGIPP